jgi:hypothetical protein
VRETAQPAHPPDRLRLAALGSPAGDAPPLGGSHNITSTNSKHRKTIMSEAMTVETIVEADWQMKGFWTKLRFPLRTARGGWSDIDILAYHPESRELVIAESKVRGPKKAIYAFTGYTRKAYGNILTYDGDNYFSFLRHIKLACKDGAIFSDFDKMVRKLIIQLVSNYFVSEDVKPEAERTVLKKIRKAVPKSVKVEVHLETTLDVISRVIASENARDQGRRYGHPVIDIARELNRYMHPQIHYAGQGKEAIEPIKRELAEKLSVALGAWQ